MFTLVRRALAGVPLPLIELAELGLFDYLLQNIDRKVCSFKVSHTAHGAGDWAELKKIANGIYIQNLHCVRPPPGRAGSGEEGAMTFLDNGSWTHARVTQEWKDANNNGFWEGFFDGNCRVGAQVAAALVRVSDDFEARFRRLAARGGEEKHFAPGLTRAVLAAIGKRVRGVRAAVRNCVPDTALWRRRLRYQHQKVARCSSECCD